MVSIRLKVPLVPEQTENSIADKREFKYLAGGLLHMDAKIQIMN